MRRGVRAGRVVGFMAVIGLAAAVPAAAETKCGSVGGDSQDLAAGWQKIEATCGCAASQNVRWKQDFKSFALCARAVALQAVLDGDIRSKCRATLVSAAKGSTCSRPPEWATCCFTNRKDKTSCRLKKSEAQCAPSANKFAELGSTETCLDACDNVSGPSCWEDTECDDANACTIDWCERADGCHHVAIQGCVPGGGGSGGTSCTGNGSSTQGLSAGEQNLLQLVNNYRSSRGRSAVKNCSSLNRGAQDHANDMRNRGYFAHLGANGSEFWERACASGYTAGCGPQTWMGEIIAASDSTASGIMNQWLNSPGHEFIMENSSYSVAGIGHACGGSLGHYWVMDFAGANESSCN